MIDSQSLNIAVLPISKTECFHCISLFKIEAFETFFTLGIGSKLTLTQPNPPRLRLQLFFKGFRTNDLKKTLKTPTCAIFFCLSICSGKIRNALPLWALDVTIWYRNIPDSHFGMHPDWNFWLKAGRPSKNWGHCGHVNLWTPHFQLGLKHYLVEPLPMSILPHGLELL